MYFPNQTVDALQCGDALIEPRCYTKSTSPSATLLLHLHDGWGGGRDGGGYLADAALHPLGAPVIVLLTGHPVLLQSQTTSSLAPWNVFWQDGNRHW